MFDITNFNKGNRLELPCKLISSEWKIWGFANENGQIFSLQSIFLNDEELKKDKLSKAITKKFKNFAKHYGHIEYILPREDKINSIVALYLLEDDDNTHNIKEYYKRLLLKLTLENDLAVSNKKSKKMKI